MNSNLTNQNTSAQITSGQSLDSSIKGGFSNNDELMLYKAKKYHYKNQNKLKEMMAQGKPCPAGYEKYLQPFSI